MSLRRVRALPLAALSALFLIGASLAATHPDAGTARSGVAIAARAQGQAAAGSAVLPARLSNAEFWRLTEQLSEPDGSFRSDNILSNEMVFARMIPELLERTRARTGGVYLGVGPEQNFTYIAHLRSPMAFVTDIRRENLHLHLVYKALFEMAKDRAEFVSLLFSKPRPAGLTAKSSIAQIMDAFWNTPTAAEATYEANLAAIRRHLTETRALPLGQADIDGLAAVYRAFYWYGPGMNYSAGLDLRDISRSAGATYHDLMTQVSDAGEPLTYLGTEERFAYIKDLQSKNLIVPVVGNFGGPTAIRAIGAYVRGRGAVVRAFYVSTVEPYLKRAGTFETFCASVATLPVDAASVFIRPGNLQNLALSAPNVALPTPGQRIGQYQIGVIVPIEGGCR